VIYAARCLGWLFIENRAVSWLHGDLTLTGVGVEKLSAWTDLVQAGVARLSFSLLF